MDNTKELARIKEQIINNVKAAAQKGDIAEISKWSKVAEQCESLIEEVAKLNSRIQEFCNLIDNRKANSNITNKKLNVVKNLDTSNLSAKQEGAKFRSEWVDSLSSNGIMLDGHGKKYNTKKGKSIGIAFANELDKPNSIDKWFLGLKDEHTDIIVLLCRDLKNTIHDIVIPVSSLGNTWYRLSRSGDQIKFNVRRQNNSFKLLIPGSEPIDVSVYVGNHQPLTS